MQIEPRYVNIAIILFILAVASYLVMIIQESIWRSVKRSDAKKLAAFVKETAVSLPDRLEQARESRSYASAKIYTWSFIQKHWGFSGTASRQMFLIHLVLASLAFGLCTAVGFVMMGESLGAISNSIGILLVVAVIISWAWFTWAISTRRMRDTGVNPWWVLTLIVPPVNLAATVFLLLVPTNEFRGKGL